MTTFTRIVRDYLLADPDMESAVRDFILGESDPVQRVLKFSVIISENFADAFGRPDDRDDADGVLIKRLVMFATEHVVWGRIAKSILTHWTTPARLAFPVGCPHRLTEALAEWHGPVN